jgi:anti-anti-sigma regulatory factor
MAVNCSVAGHGDSLTATLTGRLRLADVAQVKAALFKCLAEQPEALVVDLAGLSVSEPVALAVFSAVSRQAARWPGIAVLYCAPTDAVRSLFIHGAFRRLPLFGTGDEARASARTDGTILPSLIDDLIPIAGAAREARNLATEACLRWGLPDLVGPASLIASELVTNVVEHAGTLATLRVSLRPRFVTVGVRDGSVAEPQLGQPSPHGGRGLLLVQAMAASWGWLPVDGGKVVWASLARRQPT